MASRSARIVALFGALAIAAACNFNNANCFGYYGDDSGWPAGGDWDGGCDFCWEAGMAPTSLIRPTFLASVSAGDSPPPISGGTLLVTRDGHFAIASDPDRDRIYVVDLVARVLVSTTQLNPHDEPGRLIDDAQGRVHIVLRSGALVTLDVPSGVVIGRRSVCPAPRGIDWDASTNRVWVACATGELVGFSASPTDSTTQSFVIERDLRDVIASNGSLQVSKFRTAEVLQIAADGSVARRDQAQGVKGEFAAHVAWRAARGPAGEIVLAHQLESLETIFASAPSAYSGCNHVQASPLPAIDASAPPGTATCASDQLKNFESALCDEQPGVVVGALTVLRADGSVLTSRMFPATLPVDIAVAHSGGYAVVAAGDAFTTKLGSVLSFTACGDLTAPPISVGNSFSEQPIAVAFDRADDLIVQTREPAELWIYDAKTHKPTTVTLSTETRDDTGHDVFHTQAGSMIACASCHPEGGDDGHVWMFDGNARRTPSLRGTIEGTAPYHWPGDEATLDTLVDDVYVTRMNGGTLSADQKLALFNWVQKIPAPPAPSWIDASAAQRGRVLFNDTTIGCSGCHSGDKLTNNATVDVGTNGAFQVPPLIGVGWRTPLLHDGCAATLADRFGKCATPHHGEIGGLTQANLGDLVTYLEGL